MPARSGGGCSARSRWPSPPTTRQNAAAGSSSPWWGQVPTGVELAGQIRELATKTLRREYPHIKPEDARVMLFDGGSAPLATLGPKLSAMAARDTLVTEAGLQGIKAKDHDGNVTRYEVGTILWTAGVQAPPLAAPVAKATGAKQDRAGQIIVNKDEGAIWRRTARRSASRLRAGDAR